jgi:hypothetical protein
MKTIITLVLLTTSVVAHALTPTQKLAHAIAKAEGFGARNSKPTRLHNPGDIRARRGNAYPGQVGVDKQGYAIFKTDRAGWAALDAQIDKIVTGASRFYSVNSTLRQLGRGYATSSIWARNVAKNLGVTADTSLFDILDVPPVITAAVNDHALDFLGGSN